MIPVCDALGLPASRDSCIATFVRRVWNKLHIVLCMSPVGDALRIRCRQFPSLINCSTIDWYTSSVKLSMMLGRAKITLRPC